MHKKNKIQTLPLFTRVITIITCIFALVICLVPILWLILASLKESPAASPGFQLPDHICLKGYITTFRDLHVMRYFGNSFIVCIFSVFIGIIIVSMAAYVVARIKFPGRGLISLLLVSTLFVPATALTFPVYNIVRNLGLYNTRAGVILVYICAGVAGNFFVIKTYYDHIPIELEEAAKIDGCGYNRTFWSVVLPLARPGILTCAILMFLGHWNEYYWASLLVVDQKKLTVPALLSVFENSFSTDYNGMFSCMVVTILPPVILYCIFNKFFIEAMSGGAVKG